MKIKHIKGVLMIVALFSLLTGCFINNPKIEGGNYRIDNVRIYQNTLAWELAQAVNRQDTKQIAQIAEKNPEALNYQDPLYGTTLLHWAVGTERFNAAETLLKMEADPNIISIYEGATVLYLAAGYSWIDNKANKDPKFVKLLLEYGADPNIGFIGNDRDNITEIGTTPLMASIGCGIEKTKALVEAGANINFRTETGATAAAKAILHGGPNRTFEMLEYAHYLVVEKQANITDSYNSLRTNRVIYPINHLRNWIYPLDTDRHVIKMEIVEEFARQGVDYWETAITQQQLNQIKKLYPDTWEEYIKKY